MTDTITTEKLAKLKEKIAMLLAKAESTTFPAEAETFTEHAQRLMIRYGIEKAEIDEELGKQGQTREPIVEQRKVLTGWYHGAQLDGLCAVMGAYRLVTTLQANSRNAKVLYVVGAESDVNQMLQLAESLLIQQEAALRTWWAGARAERSWMSDREKYLERREFVRGYYRGAASKMREVVGVEAEGGKELVLVSRKARADEWVQDQYPDIKEARARQLARGSRQAAGAGAEAGRRADVNGRKLDGAGRAAIGA